MEYQDNENEEDRAQGTVSFKTYIDYFKAGGGCILTFLAILLLELSDVNKIINCVANERNCLLDQQCCS